MIHSGVYLTPSSLYLLLPHLSPLVVPPLPTGNHWFVSIQTNFSEKDLRMVEEVMLERAVTWVRWCRAQRGAVGLDLSSVNSCGL